MHNNVTEAHIRREMFLKTLWTCRKSHEVRKLADLPLDEEMYMNERKKTCLNV